jgi:hypothetical protein
MVKFHVSVVHRQETNWYLVCSNNEIKPRIVLCFWAEKYAEASLKTESRFFTRG